MKTTLEIPDTLFRKLKAQAAGKGQTLKRFVNDAIRERLASPAGGTGGKPGWMAVAGKAPAGATRQVDRVIASEFERINPADWR
jgi:hypothetical protein